MTDYRVIIAGAGPVGCVGALLLARAGVPVLLVEACRDLPVDLRASTFHPPTLDMLDTLGLTDYLIADGLVAHRYQYRDRTTGLYAEFDLRVLEGLVKHPYRVQCEQFKLTRRAVEMLADYPHADVMMSTALIGHTQDNDGVSVSLQNDDGELTVNAEYLIGADGSRSRVRELMGVDFEGFTYPEQFLVVATDDPIEDTLRDLAHVNYVSAADEWCVILRVPGNWRVLFPTDPSADPSSLKDPDEVEARLQRLAPRSSRYHVIHKSLYRIHQRVAKSYRQGRVLIGGDAAHLNNPLGGMGMNGGLHDVFNLCEKLISVLEGRAPAELLDVYDRQRRTVTWEFIQKQTIENKRRIEDSSEAARVGRIRQLQDVVADRDAAITYLKQQNMIDALERASTIA